MKIIKLKFQPFVMLIIFTFYFQSTTAQSAWTKTKGELYSQLTFSTIGSHSNIFNDNPYVTSREITDNTIQIYGEYGLSDKVTLILNIPIKSISTGSTVNNSTFPLTINETSKTDLGNIQIGLKHQLYKGKFILSGQLNIETNTSNFDTVSGIRTGYDAWTFTPTLNIGRGYKNYFFQAFSGVDLRTNNYSSNFKFGGEIGYTAIKNITVIGYIDLVSSFNNGDIELPQSNFETALYINNQEYTAIGIKGLYNLNDNLGLTLGFGSVLSANNLPRRAAISGGVFYKFK